MAIPVQTGDIRTLPGWIEMRERRVPLSLQTTVFECMTVLNPSVRFSECDCSERCCFDMYAFGPKSHRSSSSPDVYTGLPFVWAIDGRAVIYNLIKRRQDSDFGLQDDTHGSF
jgi:hypothetical protein